MNTSPVRDSFHDREAIEYNTAGAHDPMCPQYDCWLEGCTVCDECALIARVREDERKRAHNVIDRFDMFSDDREAMHAWIDGTPPNWWTEMPNE